MFYYFAFNLGNKLKDKVIMWKAQSRLMHAFGELKKVCYLRSNSTLSTV